MLRKLYAAWTNLVTAIDDAARTVRAIDADLRQSYGLDGPAETPPPDENGAAKKPARAR